MKKIVLIVVFASLAVVSSWFLFSALSEIALLGGESAWWRPLPAAVGFFLSYFSVLLLADRSAAAAVGLVALSPVLLIVGGKSLWAAIAIAAVLLLAAATEVRRDMNERVKINPRKSLSQGGLWVATALSLIVGAMYFSLLTRENVASLALINMIKNTFSSGAISMIFPAPDTAAGGEMTVDDFIAAYLGRQMSGRETSLPLDFLENYAAESAGKAKSVLPEKLLSAFEKKSSSPKEKPEAIPPQMVVALREKLARETGLPLSGNEPAADVFAQILHGQLERYARENILPSGYRFSTALAGVMAFILFISLWWLASWLAALVIYPTAGLFAILRRLKLIDIVSEETTRERIV